MMCLFTISYSIEHLYHPFEVFFIFFIFLLFLLGLSIIGVQVRFSWGHFTFWVTFVKRLSHGWGFHVFISDLREFIHSLWFLIREWFIDDKSMHIHLEKKIQKIKNSAMICLFTVFYSNEHLYHHFEVFFVKFIYH